MDNICPSVGWTTNRIRIAHIINEIITFHSNTENVNLM